jgi:hypothetical protein
MYQDTALDLRAVKYTYFKKTQRVTNNAEVSRNTTEQLNAEVQKQLSGNKRHMRS